MELSQGVRVLQFLPVGSETPYESGCDGIEAIFVDMQPGEMAMVPWLMVVFTTGQRQLWNCKHVVMIEFEGM